MGSSSRLKERVITAIGSSKPVCRVVADGSRAIARNASRT